MNRKKDCSDCVHTSENECVCAEECADYNQYLLDEDIIEQEREELLEIVREVYKESGGPWGDALIDEALYCRIERIIKKNA